MCEVVDSVEVAFSVGVLLGFGLIWCLIVVWVRGFVCGWLTWALFVDSVLDSLICRVGVVPAWIVVFSFGCIVCCLGCLAEGIGVR